MIKMHEIFNLIEEFNWLKNTKQKSFVRVFLTNAKVRSKPQKQLAVARSFLHTNSWSA